MKYIITILSIVSCIFFGFSSSHAQIISTYAGGFGTGNALNAELDYPMGITVDDTGNIYIADGGNNIVRKVSVSGNTTVIAGKGCYDFNGDGIAATECLLYIPTGVAIDKLGNVYIGDYNHSVVTKINTSGIMTVIAGNDTAGYRGDGLPAANSQLFNPAGVAVDDSGNVYIADEQNNRVRKITNYGTGTITTVAGTGTSGYSGDNGTATAAKLHGPFGVATDHYGNIYIADYYNNAIRKVNSSGTITTIAGNGSVGYTGDGGPAINATLFFPTAVAIDDSGNVYIADNQNNAVRKVNTAGIITTIAGNGAPGYSGDGGSAVTALLYHPIGVSTDHSGNVYIADEFNNRIRKINTTGIISTCSGPGYYSGDGGNALSATIYRPHGVAIDAAGNMYIADAYNSRIRKVTRAGIISTIAGTGVSGYSGDNAPAINAQMYQPGNLTTDNNGNIYFIDTNNVIRKIDNSGVITTFAGNGTVGFSGDGHAATLAQLGNPNGIAVDHNGNVYISDYLNNRIRVVDTNGIINTFAGTGSLTYNGEGILASAANIGQPQGVATDDTGNVYIADIYNYRVRKVAVSGYISTITGTGVGGDTNDNDSAINARILPYTLYADHRGNIYIIDFSDNLIRMISPNGIITHITGTSSEDRGLCGEGGIDSLADLDNPMQVAVDDSGNIYIADELTNRIRIISNANTGINNLPNNITDKMVVYPNPAGTSVNITLPVSVHQAGLAISDMLGNIIIFETIHNTTSIPLGINLASLTNGVYILSANSGNKTFREKLIVIK